jgi:four helix bundle protein
LQMWFKENDRGRKTEDRKRETKEKEITMGTITCKFQNLGVYEMSLDYVDRIYELANRLPAYERSNIRGQLERAATPIHSNIAEGSTRQTDFEQSRFLGIALRSYIETVACLDIAERPNYLKPEDVVLGPPIWPNTVCQTPGLSSLCINLSSVFCLRS